MKGTYVFEQGAGNRQTMILDELKLYIPQGHLFELAVFDDEKVAAQGFNRIMMARFSPREGWRIVEKSMGSATPPPPERMVGYEAPATTSGAQADLARSPVHVAADHLIINVETAKDAAIATALTAHRATVRHLCLYARHKATAGLAALLKNPWPGLHTLVLDAYDQTMTRQASCRVGDLGAVLPAVPELRRLYAAGQLGLGKPIKHAALTHLSLLANPLPAASLSALAKSSFPALTRLDLAVATEAAPDEGWLEALVAFLQAARPLERLTLEGPFDAVLVLEAFAPLDKKLPRELHLMGSARDEDELLAAAAALGAGASSVALGVPAGEHVEATLTGLRRSFSRVEEMESAAFLPSAYGAEAFLGRAP